MVETLSSPSSLSSLSLSVFLDARQEINSRLDAAASSMRSFNSNGFGGVRQTSLFVSNQESAQSDSHREASLSSLSQDGCRVCGELSQRCMLALTRNLLFGKGLPETEEDQSMNL
jgi:hypothetical protein